jgi:hypothetical protein
MASDSDRIIALEAQARRLMANMATFQGQPANATFSVAHNDSFPFEDNVDATHAANLRYIISKNVTRVVSARLSIFMAPYRTYNSFSATTTGIESVTHIHGQHPHSHSHSHTWAVTGSGYVHTLTGNAAGLVGDTSGGASTVGTSTDATATTPPNIDGDSVDHTHLISVTSTLGVTEGATATGVTISFDGVDHTAALGGPFNADVIELDVRQFIALATGVKHTIAMQPSGLGRIEAFLRLGVYVSASQTL